MEHTKSFPIRHFPHPTVLTKAGPDVGWEPSPTDVVDEMITLARVGERDLVYDLGCGDGRIVIAAAAKTGARGVGVDLDCQRITESRNNAIRMGVSDLTQFVNRNMFAADVSDATVLFLFLFPDVNLRLRPKLLRELKPGTRIVSYSHDMGRWQPDEVVGRADDYIYLWIVPGNISGVWDGGIEIGGDQLSLRMRMRQEFQKVSGAVFVGQKVFQVNSSMKGEAFIFSEEVDHGPGFAATLWGAVRGDTVTGILQRNACPEERLPFAARRNASTRMSLAQ